MLPASGPLLGAFLALGCQGTTQPSPTSVDLGTPADVERGRVTVAPGQAAYAEGAVVSARIANGLEVVLYTEDSKSDCSIALLERREGEDWHRVPGCSVERLPAVVAIGPGRARTVRINPRSLYFGVTAESSKLAFGAGLYRIRFTYRLKPEPPGAAPQAAVLSQTFRIGP